MNTPQRLPASLTPLDKALAELLRSLEPMAARERAPGVAPTSDIAGLDALKAWPPHDIAAVDGWALRASDLVGASSYTPLPLMKEPAWVEAGDSIPDRCDCVLDEDAVDRTGPMAQVLAEAIPGQGIRRKGGEIADTSAIVETWRPRDVHHVLRIRVVNVPGGDITARLIAQSLRAAGADIECVEAEARDVMSIAKALDVSACDLLITIGGSGVGRTDATVLALAKRGEVLVHGLALQPGRTGAVGRIGTTPVVVLPGAPDQALAVWWTMVLPTLDRLAAAQPKTATRPLTQKIASSVGIAEIVLLAEEDGAQDGAWTPLAVGDLPLKAIGRAKAWLVVPGDSEGYAAGTPVNAYLLDSR
ncbi:MAG: molybdopterin-binding protein [Bradyrhizobium sp.]|nr:molybdopterin-binding protein [Bradyrhizobium sp.]